MHSVRICSTFVSLNGSLSRNFRRIGELQCESNASTLHETSSSGERDRRSFPYPTVWKAVFPNLYIIALFFLCDCNPRACEEDEEWSKRLNYGVPPICH